MTRPTFRFSDTSVRFAWAACLAAGAISAVSAAPADDAMFVQKAAVGGLAEVEAGALARQKGASEPVKQFGSHMSEDHAKVNEELRALASSKGIAIPAAPDAVHEKAKNQLEAKDGRGFDQAFKKQMVDDHRKTIALFETEAKSGKDVELRAFAAKTLPALRQHLKMAQGL